MGEFDGAGLPLAYMLLSTEGATQEISKTAAIKDLLSFLKERRINPRFVHIDKDMSEINAIRDVWPDVKIQLCLWHVKRALKKKLSSKKCPKISQYNPQLASQAFSFIDQEFVPVVDEGAAHAVDPEEVSSKHRNFTFCPMEHREAITEMIVNNFHQHSTIPSSDGILYSDLEIRTAAVKKMYEFCVTYDLRWVWCYLWENWYMEKMWKLWARCCCHEVPVLKTTMILESHWRVVKHDYLERFNKPRMDLLVWILIERLEDT